MVTAIHSMEESPMKAKNNGCFSLTSRDQPAVINMSFILHVPLDSIIESVIAVGGVLLWVTSVCWDTQ